MRHSQSRFRTPSPPPYLRRAVRTLVDLLTALDGKERRESVEAARAPQANWILPLLIGRLIERLRSGSPSMRCRAAASLADLGRLAVPAVVGALGRSRSGVVRIRLAKVVASAAPGLDPAERLGVAKALERVMGTAREWLVVLACANAIVALCPEEEAGTARPAGAAE